MIAVLKILDDPNAWKGWGMLFGMVFVVWPLIIFWCAHTRRPRAWLGPAVYTQLVVRARHRGLRPTTCSL